MPPSPKSPRPPSRNPMKASTSTPLRAPKRLPATPSRPTPKARRVRTTPSRVADPMAPSQSPGATPISPRREAVQHPAPLRTPKRGGKLQSTQGILKKRTVGDLTPRRALPSATSDGSTSKGGLSTPGKSGKSNEKEKNPASASKSSRKVSEPKKRKVSQRDQNKDTEIEKDSLKEPTDSTRVSKKQKKRQPSITIVKSTGNGPSPVSKKTVKDQKASDKASKKSKTSEERISKSAQKQARQQLESDDAVEKHALKSKAKKKRPTPGRFDLPRTGENDEEMRLEGSSEKLSASPKITINESMSASKLRLLESSPLNRLISKKDRRAAAAELAALETEEKHEGGLNSKDSFVPLDKSKYDSAQASSADNAELEAARKKEARKLKRKVRQLRKQGDLPGNDEEEESKKSGVIYLGHIPHGFYENEMRSYFSQFGEVTRLKLSRSKKTGRSRGFAFVEFSDKEVASIAAESMDGYLMHGQALVAKVVPEENVHPDTFKGADRTFKKIPWSSVERRKIIERAKDPLKLATRSRRVRKKSKDKLKMLSNKGIKYEFPEVPKNLSAAYQSCKHDDLC